MRRRHDARVEGHLGVAADRAHRALLQRAQQLGLELQRQLADLVEEERAALGLAEQAGARGLRVGERAADVAEELAVEEVLGQRGAVDRDERALARGGCASWIFRATTSLPVPLSPVMRMVVSESATRSTSEYAFFSAGLCPMVCSSLPVLGAVVRSRLSSSRSLRWLTARSTVSTSTSSRMGLLTKS